MIKIGKITMYKNNCIRQTSFLDFLQFLFVLTLVLFFSTKVIAQTTTETKPQTLTILNWSEYFDPEIISEFEKKYNVKINEVYFETDDARDKILLQTNGIGYDLGIVNGVMIDTYKQKGWISPISVKDVPNLNFIDPVRRNSHKGTKGYTVPFSWGSLGIAYRTDLIDKPIESWMDLLKPQPSLQGKMIMITGSRELLGIALKALGYSANSENKEQIEKAGELLLAQKPFVKRYGYMSIEEKGALVVGEVVAVPAYNGDALSAQEYQQNIKFVYPKEGALLWVDHWVIYAGSTKKALATQFLNFINQPEIAARNSQYVYMAPANLAALKFLPSEFLNDPVVFPKAEELINSETLLPIQGRTLRTRSQIYNKLVN